MDRRIGVPTEWIDACPAFFAVCDAQLRLVTVNRALSDVVGSVDRVEELLPVEEQPRIARVLALSATDREPFCVQSRLVAASGRERVVEWRGGPDLTPNGDTQVLAMIGIDITNRVVAPGEHEGQEARMDQWRLIDAERLEAAGELAASVAHAVNNPLAALLGTVEMAREASRNLDPILERVHRLGRRILTVVDRTLLLFRSGALVFEPVSPKAVVEEVCAELARDGGEDCEVVTRIHSSTPEIQADAKLLAAALVRVGENAIEAAEGQAVEIEVSPLGGVAGVRFAVLDRGPGVPEAHREEAFEPFFTTRGRSTGLGLSVARGIVQGHGGRIQIDDRPGGGTAVYVEIPAEPGEVAPTGALPTSAEGP